MTARSPSDSDTENPPNAETASDAVAGAGVPPSGDRSAHAPPPTASSRTAPTHTASAPAAGPYGAPSTGPSADATRADGTTADALRRPAPNGTAQGGRPASASQTRPNGHGRHHSDAETAPAPAALGDADVEAYLRAHPDFFARHRPLLEVLHVPHPVRGATSLIEAKLRYYRERDAHLRAQMQAVYRNAEANQKLVERLHALACRLLGAETPEDALSIVLTDLRETLGDGDRVELRLFPDALDAVSPGTSDRLAPAHRMALDDFEALRDIIDAGVVLCGRHRQSRRLAAFGEAGHAIGSAVLAPLRVATPTGLTTDDGARRAPFGIGLLAIGAQDPERFRADMGTFLIEHLADLCAAAVVARRRTPQAGSAVAPAAHADAG